MDEFTDTELLDRSVATLVASWRYLAGGSPGAELIEADGVCIAAFVHSPDREFLNNALLGRGHGDIGAVLEGARYFYEERGIERYAIWVHESDQSVAAEVRARGHAVDTSTRTMAMPTSAFTGAEAAQLDVYRPGLEEFWEVAEVEGLVPALGPERAHFYLARLDGRPATTLMAFDHDGDCGIYMVATQAWARRLGLATSLSAFAVGEAKARGCATVSLQSTAMAAGVYKRVGFCDLGRFDEYVPKPSSPSQPDEKEQK